jgi:hypothetical protein
VLDVIPPILRVLRTVSQICWPQLAAGKGVSADDRGQRLYQRRSWHMCGVEVRLVCAGLYCQLQILAGMGVHPDRSTLALWVKRAAWWRNSMNQSSLQQMMSTYGDVKARCARIVARLEAMATDPNAALADPHDLFIRLELLSYELRGATFRVKQ